MGGRAVVMSASAGKEGTVRISTGRYSSPERPRREAILRSERLERHYSVSSISFHTHREED